VSKHGKLTVTKTTHYIHLRDTYECMWLIHYIHLRDNKNPHNNLSTAQVIDSIVHRQDNSSIVLW